MRQKELEEKQQELASIITVLNEQQSELDNIIACENQILASVNDMVQSESLDIESISNNNNYLVKLANDAKNQTLVIENTKREMVKKQQEINEVYKKVKSLEKLKEKQEQEYYTNIEKKISKEIDDIVTSRYKVS